MSNAQPQSAQQLTQILDLLSKFGFKFFGYSEGKEPLVIAQNGQVVTVAVAYGFVQTQMAKASAAASLGGMENMPQMPQMNQMPVSPESKLETKVESGPEKQQEKKENFGLENMPQIDNTPKQSKPAAPSTPSAGPFGDGFKVSSFDPNQVDQTMAFVKQNSKQKQTSPKKYLALQFEKFLSEIKQANKK